MDGLVSLLKAAADGSRLRILRLLRQESLNVGELTAILGIAQSSVSRHLAELRKSGTVRERRDGGFVFYELVEGDHHGLLTALLAELDVSADTAGDLARLAEVLRARVDRGDGGDGGRLLEPGRSWIAWARSLRFVLPRVDVADFGCGDGALTVEIAAWAKRVVAIDRDATVLERARRRVERAGVSNVHFRHESLETVGLRAGSVDLVIASHVLHHSDEPVAILREARRVLRPGGRLVVLELASHQEDWVRAKLHHRWLGFATQSLEKMLAEAGFDDVEVERTPAGAAPKPFRILIASGVRG